VRDKRFSLPLLKCIFHQRLTFSVFSVNSVAKAFWPLIEYFIQMCLSQALHPCFSILSFGMNGIVSMPGTVITHTRTKNILYPTACCSQPLTNPGSIMPRAMMPVEMA
jgi:hypothetical protein